MLNSSKSSDSGRRSARGRLGVVAAASTLVAAAIGVGVGGNLFADEEGSGGSPPPPGEQVNDIPTGVEVETPESGDNDLIMTSGSNFDETILTKYIPAANFQVLQGDNSVDADTVGENFGDTCVSAGSNSGGSITEFGAPVELPDGARIKRIHFYGFDNDAANINVFLRRVQFETDLAIGPGTPATDRATTTVTNFSTSGTDTDGVVFSSADDLEETTGSFSVGGGISLTAFANRFHSVRVELFNSAGDNHQLCGVRVDYQVPASTLEAGAQYFPVGPVRVYDSRLGSFTPSGLVTPNSNRVVDITDGYDLDGNAIPAQVDIVPSTATAITYNITVTQTSGPNFTSVTAGDATSFTTSAINFASGDEIANAGTVTISNGEIKIWGGGNTGSTHVIIDVTGFYAPGPPPPNMGN